MLPISNPANLVIYGDRMPSLLHWLPLYALPSLLAIGATYLGLRFTQRRSLRETVATPVARPRLSAGGKIAAFGIAGTALVLLAASAMSLQLGLSTLLVGLLTVAVVSLRQRSSPVLLLKGVSWSVLPLVAGLFVLVEAVDNTGVIAGLAGMLRDAAARSPALAAWAGAATVAMASNIMNNLPAGLIAAGTVGSAHAGDTVTGAILIGVDIGPNLSVTGSLATILWLSALRREGVHFGGWTFLKLGAVVMPPALILAIAGLLASAQL